MKRTCHGSCHCGAIRFACEIDLAGGSSRGNCSMCLKSRSWKMLVKAQDLALLQGADALAEYQFGSRTIRHTFCRHCGVKVFGRAYLDVTFEGEALRGEYYAINVTALDDVTPAELAAIPVRYEDGRHDDWASTPKVTSHL